MTQKQKQFSSYLKEQEVVKKKKKEKAYSKNNQLKVDNKCYF